MILIRKIYFAEVKMNSDKIKMNKLKNKSENVLKRYRDYQIEYEGLSLSDIDRKMKENNITKFWNRFYCFHIS